MIIVSKYTGARTGLSIQILIKQDNLSILCK